jgi:hypothetical protein
LYFGDPGAKMRVSCMRCQARQILTFLLALSGGIQDQEPLIVPYFTSLAEKFPS